MTAVETTALDKVGRMIHTQHKALHRVLAGGFLILFSSMVVGQETGRVDEAEMPRGTAITSRRDASTEIPAVHTAVSRDASKSDVVINWENVTLKDCIEVLSRDLGMEFIISPSVNVSQEVSIRAGDVTTWTREHKLEMFDAILDTAGIQRTERGRVWIFAPSDIRPIITRFDDNELSAGQPVIGAIRLKHITAGNAQQFITQISGKQQRAFAITGAPVLIVLGTKAYLRQMEELIQLVDFPPAELSHFVLKEASAEDVARELTSIFYRRPGVDGTSVRFTAIPRLNTVVAQNLSEGVLVEIGNWVKLLDRSDDQNERITKVYRMQVIEAEEIGKTLSKLYSDLYKQAQLRERELGKTATKVSAASSAAAKAAAAKAAKKPTSGSTAKLPPAPPSTSKTSTAGTVTSMDEEVIILSDKDTNTLIINAPADMHRAIAATIQDLDQSRRQVLIETAMVEVTLDEGTDLGIEWAVQGESEDPFRAGSQISGMQLGGLVDGSIPLTGVADGLTYFITSTDKKMALIQAAKEANRLQVLSSPNVLTRDGMEAEVAFGKEVPVRQSSVTDGGRENFSFDYRDAKIELKVTPHIDDNDMVTLNLEQTIRRVEESSLDSEQSAPIFRTREIRSNLQVDSGQTIILGGLIERADVDARVGIPLLMDIPLLGRLFGRTVKRKEGAEILMILTPHVVNSRDETDLLSRDFRRKILGAMSEKNVRDLYDLEDGEFTPHRTVVSEPGESSGGDSVED